jgi:CRISPR-associated protein Cmr6
MGAGKSLAQALLEKQKKLEQMGIEVKEPEEVDIPNRWETSPKRVPMMYRAQVQGRSSLHNAQKRKDGKNSNLDVWSKEWINPTVEDEARYQRSMPELGQEGDVYRIAVKFPFRLFSNGGQDSIMRPMLGKDGIPFFPGSSVKGLFLRACGDRKAAQYCGREVREEGKLQHLPGEMPLRFLGAYPVGDWADRVVDLVHPQGNRQIGTGFKEERSTASALISLCEPTMVFEFSCADRGIQWRDVEFILLKALQLGVGGKTSSGYGLGGNFPGKSPINPASPISVLLKGDGVSSVLRDGETPEFRTNLFKAGLRGHLRRLLGGVSESKAQEVADRWFGNTKAPATVQLLWQERAKVQFDDVGLKDRNPTYRVNGMLYADMRRLVPIETMTATDKQQYDRDVALLSQVVTFAYVMGGFGKSWRRVWHGRFLPDYHAKNFAIGCHWSSSDLDEIQTEGQLKAFLEGLHRHCCEYLGIGERNARAASWREAWSPRRVAVFCRVGAESEAVGLFHDEVFKTTPAIGGRIPHRDHPERFNPPQNTSSVWHRMLPLKNGAEFLEIVTVFYGDRIPWKRDGVDQLLVFTQALKDRGLTLNWGLDPSL